MNPQRSEKKKEPGRSQKGFERSSRKRGSSTTHGQEHHDGPGGQHEQPHDEFDDQEKDTD